MTDTSIANLLEPPHDFGSCGLITSFFKIIDKLKLSGANNVCDFGL